MTRPEQPQEYGAQPLAKPVLSRSFRDPLNRPLSGHVVLRDLLTDASVRIPVVDGLLSVELIPGDYRIIGVFSDVDGNYYYPTETVTL